MVAAYTQLLEIDAAWLKYFATTFTVRMYVWDNYRQRRALWNIPEISTTLGLGFDMRKRRVGVPC